MKAETSKLALKVIPKAKFTKSGNYGCYARYGKYGIKFIRVEEGDRDDSLDSCAFDSLKDLRSSHAWKEARKEARILKKASSRTTLVPEFYEAGIYKIGKRFFAGIIMEHIKGKTLSKSKASERGRFDGSWDLMEDIMGKLERCGIRYNDHNTDNFIFDSIRKTWRCIDFSPDWSSIIR